MLRWLKDHCVPHAGNDFRPHLLQKVAMVAMLGLVLVSFALANMHALLWLNVDWLISAVLPAVVVEETNDERAGSAIGPLTRNTTLDRAAQLKAEHMAEIGYFAHYAPDGTSPWHWFRSVNYPFVHAGENLAVHFNDSHEVVEAWMNSPTHRANILNGTYTEIGIGVAEGEFEGYDTVFVVQMFGAPAAAAPAAVTAAEPATPIPVTPPAPAASTEIPRVAAAEESNDETFTAPETTAAPVVADVEEAPAEPAPLPSSEAVSDEPIPEPVMEETTRSQQPTDTPALVTTPAQPETEQFISTTTNAVPANIEPEAVSTSNTVGFFGRIATSPQTWLQALYTSIGLFVLAVLALSLVREFRQQHPVQVAYSFGLLAVMGGLYYLQTLVTTGATIALVG